jgi:hypothetical protein
MQAQQAQQAQQGTNNPTRHVRPRTLSISTLRDLRFPRTQFFETLVYRWYKNNETGEKLVIEAGGLCSTRPNYDQSCNQDDQNSAVECFFCRLKVWDASSLCNM